MTVRSDVQVDFNVSPRIILVDAPSTEITIQDLVDTLREIEDGPAGTGINANIPQQGQAITEDRLIDAAGKESLGGGVEVGITATLNNAQLAFEPRDTETSTGTHTAGDSTTSLTDGSADFVAEGVTRGATVLNLTDGSIGDVLTISTNTLTLRDGLNDGSDNTFQTGDSYEVYNIIQMGVAGGNLVAVDDVGADLDPIFPTAFTQVVRTASSSATIQNQESLESAAYQGTVVVDVAGGTSGTTFPTGTFEQPVDSLTDALTISAERGLRTIRFLGDTTINTGDYSNLTLEGEGVFSTTLTLGVGATFTNASFRAATITGTIDETGQFDMCEITALTFASPAEFRECTFKGSNVVTGTGLVELLYSSSGVPGASTPTISLPSADLIARNWNGGMELTDIAGGQDISLDYVSGQLVLAASNTSGSLVIRGNAKLTDNSVGLTVDAVDLIQPSRLLTIAKFLGLK